MNSKLSGISLQISEIENLPTFFETKITPQQREAYRRFMSPAGYKRYIFGYNIYTQALLRHFNIDAIVDDLTQENHYLGVPIIKSSHIETSSVTLVASAGKPNSIMRNLDQHGHTYIHYFTFLHMTDLPLPQIMFNEDFRQVYSEYYTHFNSIFHALSDRQSKESYYCILAFRFSLDIRYLTNFVDLQSEQYFESFVKQPRGSVFIDIGSYDGYTSLAFASKYPDYRSIYVFEPDPDNYKKSIANLSHTQSISINNIGISSEKAILYLTQQNSQSALSTSSTASIAVSVDSLDNLAIDNVTYIKADVEGHEENVLLGAQLTIGKYKPHLAISSYHSSLQLFKIPQLALSINPQYKLFFRHYTESIYESVFYMIHSPTQ